MAEQQPPKTPGTDLVPFDQGASSFPVLFDAGDGSGGIAQIIEDNFGDDGFSPADLDRVTVPSGGGTAWDIPDEDPARTIDGVVVFKQPTRSMWFKKRGEDGEDDGPPDCYSGDAKIGVGAMGPGSPDNPTGECLVCPFNVYGTANGGDGAGKQCKEQMQLFLLQPNGILPIQVSLPPTSLKPFRKYMTRLASKGKSYFAVVTRMSLKVEKGNGQTYSVVEFVRGDDLHSAEAGAARAFGQTMGGLLQQAATARAAAASADAEASVRAGEPDPAATA